MIFRYVPVATVHALLRLNTGFWGLREFLEPQLIAAARRLSSLIVPKPSVRIFERDGPDDIKDCQNGQCLGFRSDGQPKQSYWMNVRLGRHFCSSKFRNDAEGKGAEPTMSVMVLPKQQSRPGFLSVPELRNPMVFDRGRLCLGYEKCKPESWNLVVRQISDWRLVGKRSLFQGQPYLIDHDNDLIILYSNDGEIHIWNPYLPEPWKLEHAGATIFERPRILPNRTGFVTTSRKSRKDIFEDIQVFVCQSISWQDTEKCPHWKLTSYRVPLFSYFPGTETRSYECLRSFTVIWDISRSGILFNSSLIGSIAITYTGEELGPTLPNKQKIVGEFSDGARVIYSEGHTAYVPSYVQIMKNDKVHFELRHRDDFDGILLFLDTYLIIVDKDINFPSPHCRLRIFTRAGGLIHELRLGSEYSTYHTRIFEEGHSIVLYSKDLSEATVWNFGKTFPVPSVARSKSIRRANEHPESRYNLRRKIRKSGKVQG
jgi:hypothetical protein